ncbi:MAG: plastocyanin/azurin family copper-binding protein [Gemmatimonadales bacterium]
MAGRHFLLALAGAFLVGACGESLPPPGPPAQLVKSGGDQQSWFFDNPLPIAYRVTVEDANGRGVPGVTVVWAVTAGGGSITAFGAVTDGDGRASATHTLGPSETSQQATATVVDLSPSTFTATAGDPPTTVGVSIQNNSFNPDLVGIQAGGTVTWTWNSGSVDHNVTFTGGPQPLPTNSTTKNSGTYPWTFNATGTYTYVCNIHAGMSGRVVVVQ